MSVTMTLRAPTVLELRRSNPGCGWWRDTLIPVLRKCEQIHRRRGGRFLSLTSLFFHFSSSFLKTTQFWKLSLNRTILLQYHSSEIFFPHIIFYWTIHFLELGSSSVGRSTFCTSMRTWSQIPNTLIKAENGGARLEPLHLGAAAGGACSFLPSCCWAPGSVRDPVPREREGNGAGYPVPSSVLTHACTRGWTHTPMGPLTHLWVHSTHPWVLSHSHPSVTGFFVF